MTPGRPAEVRNLRLLVEARANSLAHQLSDHGVASTLGNLLDSVTDIAGVVADDGGSDANLERFLRHGQQPLDVRADLTDRKGLGRIRVQPFQGDTTVHGLPDD